MMGSMCGCRRFNWLSRFATLLVSLSAAFGARETAAIVIVYGGPQYDSTTDIGYTSILEFGYFRVPVNNSGAAVGWARKHDGDTSTSDDNRAVRWDPTSALEVDYLGAADMRFTQTIARDINNSGVAVGFSSKRGQIVDAGYRAVRWDSTGAVAAELGHLGTSIGGYTRTEAYAVNDLGTTVGFATKWIAGADKGYRAVRWDGTGTTATELANLGTDNDGNTTSYAYAVNQSGAVAGWASEYVSGVSHGTVAVRWDSTGTAAVELEALGADYLGRFGAQAYALNDSGTVVGVATKFVNEVDLGTRAVRWDAASTSVIELDNLGTDGGDTNSRAYDVNNSGVAVGVVSKYVAGVIKGDRAVRWNSSGTSVTELGNLGTSASGTTNTYARSINDSGIIVGTARKYSASGSLIGDRAVAWMRDGVAIELNTLIGSGTGWTLTSAYNISDAGWISGIGQYNPPGPGASYSRHFVLKFLQPPVGDYNANGTVDSADYVLWRDSLGQMGSGLAADGNVDGKIDADDYDIWRDHFGETSEGGSGAVGFVPEPTVQLLLPLAALFMRRARKRLS